MQAQVLPAAALALRARAVGLTAADVDAARLEDRSIVWTWGPRGTLHLLAPEDLGWLLPLVARRARPRALRRLARLGVGGDAPARACRLIGRMLGEEGPLTREEIAERLARRGIVAVGQAAFHLVRLAGLEGVACPGPDRDGRTAFVLVRDWVGALPAPAEEAALAELGRRYLAAYGPAAPADLAAWSGLGTADAGAAWRGISERLVEVDAGGRRLWTLRSRGRPAPPGIVRLLPSFDVYLLGYESRELAVPPQHARRVNAGGGWLHPVVVSDGRAVGTWSSGRRGVRLTIAVRPFAALDPGIEAGIVGEARDVARFLGLDPDPAIVSVEEDG